MSSGRSTQQAVVRRTCREIGAPRQRSFARCDGGPSRDRSWTTATECRELALLFRFVRHLPARRHGAAHGAGL